MSRISIPYAVLGFQGTTNIAVGLYGLMRSAEWKNQLTDQFGGDIPIAMAYAISLQMLNMGIFTIFAANRPSLHRQALIARASLHALAGYMFWTAGAELRSAALLDIGSAVIDTVALLIVGGARMAD